MCVLMMMGRHRGLPTSLDTAVRLVSRKEDEENARVLRELKSLHTQHIGATEDDEESVVVMHHDADMQPRLASMRRRPSTALPQIIGARRASAVVLPRRSFEMALRQRRRQSAIPGRYHDDEPVESRSPPLPQLQQQQLLPRSRWHSAVRDGDCVSPAVGGRPLTPALAVPYEGAAAGTGATATAGGRRMSPLV